MKKSLLFLASMFIGVMAFAQRVAPVPSFTALVDDGETILYLYNIEYGGFLLGANEWGTRASLSKEKGYKMKIAQMYEDDEKTIPLGTWALCDSCEAGGKAGKWSEYDCQGYDNIWCDGDGRGGAGMWVLTALGGNKYEITNTNVPGLNFGWAPYVGDATNNRVWMLDYEQEESEGMAFLPEQAGTEWAFVTPEAYEAWQVEAVVYVAAENLKAQIEYAKGNGISDADLAEYQAVYDNPNSTVEELNAAAEAAYDKGRWVEIEEYFKDIVQGEKNDVSGVFVNNDFSEGNANGWDITYEANSDAASNIGYQGASYSNGDVRISGFIEAWKNGNSPNYLGDGSVTQTIPALPAGKYMLAVDVIASNQGRISDANNPNGYPDDVELFAQASLDGQTYKTNLYTKDGAPEHFEFTFVHTGGAMTLGLRVVGSAEARMPANWIAMDNLQLFYYGQVTEDPDKVLLDAAIDKALAAYPLEDVDGLVATVSLIAEYKALIAEAQAATADYLDYIPKVEAAVSALDASVAAYEKLEQKSAEWAENLITFDFDSEEWIAYSDFVQNMDVPEGYPAQTPEEALANHTLTTEEVNNYITTVDNFYKTAVATSLTPGMDCSMLLTNASFGNGFEGWTNARGTFGGLKDYPCVEVYEGAVDCYQVVEGVPDGVYSLSCQAFYRPGGNGSYDGSEPSKVFLYMNELQTPVQNIMADALPEDQAEDKVNCFISGGDPTEDFYSTGGTTNADYLSSAGYVPNGMSGASYAFRAGRYVQKVYGLVEGGTMKIGLTSNGETAHWVLWSKFQLIYEGKGSDATEIMLQEFLTSLTNYLEENSDNMTTAAYNAASAAITKAEEAIADRDSEAMTASITEVQQALEDARANVAAVTEFLEVSESLIAAVESEEANPDGIEAYNAISDEIDDYMNLTTAELETLISKMKAVISQLNLPEGWQNASDSNPVDFTKLIVNSTFDTIGDFTGWSAGFGAGGTTSTNAECYEKTFDVYQDIVGLPAGTYKVGVQGYYRQGSAADDYKNTRTEEGTPAYNAVIYATGENGETSSNPIMSICAVLLENGLGGGTSTVGGEGGAASYVVPNTMEAATYWFDATDEEGNSLGYYAPNDQFNFAVVKVGEDGNLRIGVKKDVTITSDWAIFDNFTLTYYGKSGLTAISEVEKSAISSAATGIYTVAGARVATLKKGINIIKMADGSVRKVYVK